MSAYPFALINLAALKHNLTCLQKHAPQSKVMSVIKADAYGHGALKAAQALDNSDAFAVARLSEGLLLRQQGINQPIVLLEGVNSADELITAAENDLSPVIHSQSQIDWLVNISLPKPLSFIWLMVNSGMNRLGMRPDKVQPAHKVLSRHANVTGEIGLMSHFANADMVDDVRNQQQLDIMLNLQKQTGLALSLANSAAIFSLPDSHQQWIRPGVSLYGLSPFYDKTGSELGLQPVMQLTTQLIASYSVGAGEQVGYGGDWQAERTMQIGVVDLGYGDGYHRILSGRANIMIGSQQVPVIGRVSMDMLCVDLTTCQSVTVGDELVAWGDTSMSVEQVALWADTIPYELVTGLTSRVKRQYING